MRVIMVGSLARAFTIMNKHTLYGLFLGILLLGGCKNEHPIPKNNLPYAYVNISLNLSLLTNQDLLNQGYKYIDNEGVSINGRQRGIVVVKDRSTGEYKAFDRTCPYEPEKDCSTVDAKGGGLYLGCECGNAFYDLNGYVTGPPDTPSQMPLKRYFTYLDGNYLYIKSESL